MNYEMQFTYQDMLKARQNEPDTSHLSRQPGKPSIFKRAWNWVKGVFSKDKSPSGLNYEQPNYTPGQPTQSQPTGWTGREREMGVPPGGISQGDLAWGIAKDLFPKTTDKVTGYYNTVNDRLNQPVSVDTGYGQGGLYAIPNWALPAAGIGLLLLILMKKR